MTVKALKQPATTQMLLLKREIWRLVSDFEFRTGELVSTIEIQDGDRDGVLQSPNEISVYLEDGDQPVTDEPVEDRILLTQAGAEALAVSKGAE